MKGEIEVIYQDKYLLVVNKPAGFVVQGALNKEESLLFKLKDFIKRQENKQGEVFLAVVHRLDKPVSGVCLLAKRSKCASKLHKLLQEHKWSKVYLAKVEGSMKGEPFGLWEDYLIRESSKRGVKLVPYSRTEAKRALTFYMILERKRNSTLLLLSPLTGRKHQLRVVLSARGYPILGDSLYGARSLIQGGKAILLHALYLTLPHPYTQEKLELWAELPSYFKENHLDKEVILEFLNRVNIWRVRLENVSSKDLGEG